MSSVASARPDFHGGARKIPVVSQPFSVTLRVEPDGRIIRLVGREAWAMRELVMAGERGCTPIENPAPRWSHYVWLLRRTFVIETIHEPHGGPFSGTHARYVLRTPVTLLEEGVAG